MARGRYKIVRKIADGGMAEIFLGTQHGVEGFERPVVLKRILAALLADPKFKDMMIDEAHVAMSLIHSNIAQVLDLGQAKGRYYLVLEFVDGWDLNQVIHRMNTAAMPLPPELALYITAEVCRALSYAHSKTRAGRPLGIVHRDVSPHNVLLSEQGEVKLTDFGIAKAITKRGENTLQGVIKGKLAFMSPEQASGTAMDARSDLFSVGTMLYLLLVGRRPFEAATDLEAILRVQRCEFPPPETVRADLDPRAAAVIRKAMQHAPADRHQTAEQLLIELESLQRTVFRAAGQTELKRWLGDLEKRDGVPSVGRTRGGGAPTTAELPELDEGDFVLEETGEETAPSGDPDETIADPGLLATAPLPTLLAHPSEEMAPRRSTGSTHIEQLTPVSVDDDAPGAGSDDEVPRRRGTLFLLAVAGAAGAAYWLWPNTEEAPEPPRAPDPESPPTPSPAEPNAAQPNAVQPKVEQPNVEQPNAAAPDASQARSAMPPADAAATAPAPSGTDAAEAAEDEPDEESLLAQREPDAEQAVIGEDKEDEAATPAPRPRKNVRPGNRPPPPPTVVSIRIVSRPEGAIIRLHNRVFGRAPMNLRFRSGIRYELSFVKSGYVTATKTFTASRRKNQVVTVSLQRKPDPKKRRGFFDRLFGR